MIYDTINDAQTIAGNGEGTLLAERYRVLRQLGNSVCGTRRINARFALKR